MTQLFDNYSRMGDMAVIAVCSVIYILLGTSYVKRTRSYRIFCAIVGNVFLAAIVNIAYHDILIKCSPSLITLVYILRLLYYALLFNIFFLFSLYIAIVSNLEHRKARLVAITASILFAAIMAADIILTVNGTGFVLSEDGAALHGSNVFMIGYVLFVATITLLMYSRLSLRNRAAGATNMGARAWAWRSPRASLK